MRGLRSWDLAVLVSASISEGTQEISLGNNIEGSYFHTAGPSKSTTITFTMVGSADQPSGPGCFRYKPPLKTLLQESRGGARLLVIEMETSKLHPACGYCAKWRTKEDNKGEGLSCWVGCEGCL